MHKNGKSRDTLSRVEGPEVGPAMVDRLLGEPALKTYHLLPSVRGDLLYQPGRYAEAGAALLSTGAAGVGSTHQT